MMSSLFDTIAPTATSLSAPDFGGGLTDFGGGLTELGGGLTGFAQKASEFVESSRASASAWGEAEGPRGQGAGTVRAKKEDTRLE